jgi:nicotinate-nucleotide pyrophosphorylase (carboxylating)
MELSRLPAVQRLIELAIEEDLGRGDATTTALIEDPRSTARARLVARQDLVVFGVDVARAVFDRVDPTIRATVALGDGEEAAPGATVLELEGPAATLLMAERTALNFLQRLSGIATLTRAYVRALAGTATRVVDTRKTTPGWRVLEKAAVVGGGGTNHRADLGSGILIKDNHIAACGSVGRAVGRVHAAGRLVEVSGGITLATVRGYADAGADLISVGALTHSARAVDLGVDFR